MHNDYLWPYAHMSTPKAQVNLERHTLTHLSLSLTDCDGVDGVGVAVIVAVVIVLTSIATGNHKDAAEALPPCNHPVLQRRLWRKKIHAVIKRGKIILYLTKNQNKNQVKAL